MRGAPSHAHQVINAHSVRTQSAISRPLVTKSPALCVGRTPSNPSVHQQQVRTLQHFTSQRGLQHGSQQRTGQQQSTTHAGRQHGSGSQHFTFTTHTGTQHTGVQQSSTTTQHCEPPKRPNSLASAWEASPSHAVPNAIAAVAAINNFRFMSSLLSSACSPTEWASINAYSSIYRFVIPRLSRSYQPGPKLIKMPPLRNRRTTLFTPSPSGRVPG